MRELCSTAIYNSEFVHDSNVFEIGIINGRTAGRKTTFLLMVFFIRRQTIQRTNFGRQMLSTFESTGRS